MKNILIPTDFSENSQDAIKYALEYFSGIPVNFYLLHASPNQIPHTQPPNGAPKSHDSPVGSNTSLTQLQEEIKYCKTLTLSPLHKFFCIHENISLVEAVRKNLIEKEIDYIVMGTKGVAKKNGTDIGSNTGEVITKVKCPILVVPRQARFNGIKNIAFPTDYNCIYKDRVVSTMSEMLKLQNASLRILNIKSNDKPLSQEQLDNKSFLQDYLKDINHSFHFLENNKVEMGIQDFVETWEIDMIAMVAKKLNLIQRLLFNPIDKSIRYHKEIPFLVVHE